MKNWRVWLSALSLLAFTILVLRWFPVKAGDPGGYGNSRPRTAEMAFVVNVVIVVVLSVSWWRMFHHMRQEWRD